MPVNTPHPEYADMAECWMKARDCFKGEEAVKARGSMYLPSLEGQTSSDYEAYKMRAMFFSASGRTVKGLSGAILRKPPVVKFPNERLAELEKIGHEGESLLQVAKMLVDETIAVGRAGLLVDAPASTRSPTARAYISIYYAENIINWRQSTSGEKKVTTLVVLKEMLQLQDEKDEFETVMVEQYRVLKLGTAPAYEPVTDSDGKIVGFDLREGWTTTDVEAPFYYQELWREELNQDEPGAEKKFIFIGSTVPKQAGGRLLREIPFVFINPDDCGACPKKPPLMDLMNVNLSHYRNSADLEHGRHFTALPTPWVAGFEPAGEKLTIGSGVAWVASTHEARAGMLEFTGAGLKALSEGMKDKETLMAVLGARLLEGQRPGVESAESIRLRSAGEQSALANVAMSVSDALSLALMWYYGWTTAGQATPEQAKIELNKDFNLVGIDSVMLEKLMIALQSGLISWDTWAFNLARGEVLPDGVTPDIEAERIAAGLPDKVGESILPEPEPQPTGGSSSGGTSSE